MAQPGQTTIQLYSTTTTATTPSPSNLVSGELALNLTDKKLFTKDGSGNVIEMTPSPTNALAVGSGGTGATSAASARANLDALAATNPSYTGTLTGGTGVVNLGSGQFVKDASGNVGVGVTPSAWAAGHRVAEFGTVANSVTALSGGDFSIANNAFLGGSGWVYKVSAGATRFQQDFGVSRWVIDSGTKTAGAACNFTVAMTLDASGNLLPGANGTQAFGSTSLRWSQVWCTAGAFNTSDARLKTVPVSFTAKEVAAAKALSKEIALYQWLESVEAKGADKARWHVGLTVQRAEQVLKEQGLDPWRYGFMSYDKWDDVTVDHPATEAIEAVDAVLDGEGNVVTPAVEAVPAKPSWTEVTLKAGEAYAFRYDQLSLFISRGLNAEIEAMQAQLDAQNTAMQLLASRLAALEAA